MRWVVVFRFSSFNEVVRVLRAGKHALENFHLGLGILPHSMVRGSPAPHSKPFFKLWIPADFWMFHGQNLYHGRLHVVCLDRDVAAINLRENLRNCEDDYEP